MARLNLLFATLIFAIVLISRYEHLAPMTWLYCNNHNNAIYISKIDGLYEHRIPAALSYVEYDRNTPNTRKVIDSTLYFNGFVRDIFVVKEKIFLGTNNGLFIFDLESGELLDRYTFFDNGDLDKFSFLRNIVKINYFSDFLVLLTKHGLIKFSMEL